MIILYLNFADIIKRDLGKDIKYILGASTAGGLGAGLLTFLDTSWDYV